MILSSYILAFALMQAVETPDLDHPWTLQECTEWALEHNLTVAAQALNVESSGIEKNTADMAWLPSVNGSASQNWSFGRGIGGNNTYESGNSASTSFNLGANMNLFDGLATPRRMQLAALNLEAATADLEKARNDIRVQVAQAYVQILYNYEIADVAHQQLAIDSLQVARLEGMFSTGKASAAEVSQQKASLAQSQVTLVQAQNNVRASLLALRRVLGHLHADAPDRRQPGTERPPEQRIRRLRAEYLHRLRRQYLQAVQGLQERPDLEHDL